MSPARGQWGALAGLLLATGCSDPGRFPMSERSQEAGLAMRVTSGRSPSSQLLEVKGGSLALFDGDGDGDLDLVEEEEGDSWDMDLGGEMFESPYIFGGALLFIAVIAGVLLVIIKRCYDHVMEGLDEYDQDIDGVDEEDEDYEDYEDEREER